MTDANHPPARPRSSTQRSATPASTIRIGGKTYSGLDDLPPDARLQLEQTLKQMRDSGMLEDKNRDGIPDRFETPLRIAGWIGKLTGNPHLRERIQQQMSAFGVTADTAHRAAPASPRASVARVSTASSGQARAKDSSSATGRAPLRERATARAPIQSVVQRSSRDMHAGTGLREFLRKLVIVSSVVIAGYLALRLMGLG